MNSSHFYPSTTAKSTTVVAFNIAVNPLKFSTYPKNQKTKKKNRTIKHKIIISNLSDNFREKANHHKKNGKYVFYYHSRFNGCKIKTKKILFCCI
jgi:hypothetical protein